MERSQIHNTHRMYTERLVSLSPAHLLGSTHRTIRMIRDGTHTRINLIVEACVRDYVIGLLDSRVRKTMR